MRRMSSIIALATLTGCGPTQPNPPGFTTDPSLGGSGSTSVGASGSTSGGGSSGSSSAPSTGGESMTADPTTTSATTTSGTSSTSSTVSTSDTGSDTDLTGEEPMGCGGKIDFLFVMSRQHNLDSIQTQLIDAFPKFIDTIASKFEDFDYHIMVVDTDDYWGQPWQCTHVCPDLACLRGEPCCLFNLPEGKPCCPLPDYPCGQLGLITECDETLGGGVTFPAGHDATNVPCKIDGDHRYLTKGQSELSETFACIAKVGSGGGNEVGAALAAAVDPSMNGPGGCNDGFLRDDALLMVTMVSPGLDDSFTGSVKEWYEAVVAAKNGDPEAIVMFLIGNPECPDYDDTCKLAKKFPNVLVSDSDELDYGPAFDEASAMAEDACKVLIPG